MFHLHFLFLATDLLLAWNPVCLGLVEGVIGKIQLHTGKWRMKNISPPAVFFCLFCREHALSCQYFPSVITRHFNHRIFPCLLCFLLTREGVKNCVVMKRSELMVMIQIDDKSNLMIACLCGVQGRKFEIKYYTFDKQI